MPNFPSFYIAPSPALGGFFFPFSLLYVLPRQLALSERVEENPLPSEFTLSLGVYPE